jgi:hypothetical protein
VQEESEEPADTSPRSTGKTGPIVRVPEVDAPFTPTAALLGCLKISTVIYEDALVIC